MLCHWFPNSTLQIVDKYEVKVWEKYKLKSGSRFFRCSLVQEVNRSLCHGNGAWDISHTPQPGFVQRLGTSSRKRGCSARVRVCKSECYLGCKTFCFYAISMIFSSFMLTLTWPKNLGTKLRKTTFSFLSLGILMCNSLGYINGYIIASEDI